MVSMLRHNVVEYLKGSDCFVLILLYVYNQQAHLELKLLILKPCANFPPYGPCNRFSQPSFAECSKERPWNAGTDTSYKTVNIVETNGRERLAVGAKVTQTWPRQNSPSKQHFSKASTFFSLNYCLLLTASEYPLRPAVNPCYEYYTP